MGNCFSAPTENGTEAAQGTDGAPIDNNKLGFDSMGKGPKSQKEARLLLLGTCD
jgi:hypothetical protein